MFLYIIIIFLCIPETVSIEYKKFNMLIKCESMVRVSTSVSTLSDLQNETKEKKNGLWSGKLSSPGFKIFPIPLTL